MERRYDVKTSGLDSRGGQENLFSDSSLLGAGSDADAMVDMVRCVAGAEAEAGGRSVSWRVVRVMLRFDLEVADGR